MRLWLPAPRRTSWCFELERAPGADFTEREMRLLTLLRPRLARLRSAWEAKPRSDRLTAREHEVLDLVAEGLTNREVAMRLSISPATVRTHLEHVYEKLTVRTRTAAVTAARRAAS